MSLVGCKECGAQIAKTAAICPQCGVYWPGRPTNYTVILIDSGPQRINTIQALREATDLSLQEAIALVDGTPSTIKVGAYEDEAEAIRKKFTVIGATVKIVTVS
jgi:large subunit ribosomal protein L7/L12